MWHLRRQQWQSFASVFRIGLTAAMQGLRYYHTTALLLGFAMLGAIYTVLPLGSLFGRPNNWLGFRPILLPVGGGDLGLPWMMDVAGPSAAQHEAVSMLGTLLLLAVGGSILIAIVTILSLGAARSIERRTERQVQRAAGASRRTLLAAALIELLVVAAIPVLVGGLIGIGAARSAAASWPGHLVSGTGAVTSLATALVLIVFAGVLLVPALVNSRRVTEGDIAPALPTFPVVFQTAICFIVLSTGALLSARARELSTIRPTGTDSGTVVSIWLDGETARERSARFHRLLDGISDAGIHSASLTSPGTLLGLGHVATVLTDCGMCTEGGLSMSVRIKPAAHKVVSADTFRLMGLSVVAGRGITPGDDWGAPRVAVVNRSLAAREFQDGKPLGRRIHTGDDDTEGSTVVGIVDDQLPVALGGTLQPRHAVYVSVLQHLPQTVDLLIRDPVDPDGLRRILNAALGRSGQYSISSERALREAQIAPVRWFGRRFELQGWALIGLASLGILAFMGLWVHSLRGEIAVRRSVGARRYQILRWVVSRALAVAFKGIVAGLWFGISIWGTLPAAVTGTLAWDPSRFLPYVVLVVGVVVGSVLLPAWRASRALPAELLQAGS